MKAGLGFRRELLHDMRQGMPNSVSFLELAPENWIRMGGRSAKDLRAFTERFPFVAHGLSLSIGSPAPLNEALVHDVRDFMREHGITLYTEHLSWCSDDGQLYDLLPIPFTSDAVRWVAERIRRVQDIIGCRMAIENASYYVAPPDAEMDEIGFIRAVVEEADCLIHLDVNNVYVNSINHQYDAATFIRSMPVERIAYMHVAGHYVEAEDLIVDTHGADVIDPVFQLLDVAYQHCGPVPTLLERDFNFPPLAQLGDEVARIAQIQARHAHRPTALANSTLAKQKELA